MDGFGRRNSPSTRTAAAKTALKESGEGRFAPRRKSEIPAMIYFEGTTISVPCLIRDMSTTGARLQLREGWSNPFTSDVKKLDQVRLVIRNDRVMYDCRIVRHDTTELGVKFLAAPKPMSRGR